MNTADREARVVETFVTLADTLVTSYDVVDLLQGLVETCAEVLDVTAAGIMLADPAGELEVVASTSETGRLIEVLQLAAESGPCLTSYRTGEVVSSPDVTKAPEEWHAFRDGALGLGVHAVHAIPLRLRSTVIGTLNLFSSHTGALQPSDARIGKALADVATIGIVHERTLREQEVLQAQLQRTLGSRVVIEQAKGVVAHTRGIPMEDAFAVLRAHAATTGTPLSDVAQAVVDRTLRL